MTIARTTPTRTRSIADILRAMAVLEDAGQAERTRAYALFGVKVAPPPAEPEFAGTATRPLDRNGEPGAEAAESPHRPERGLRSPDASPRYPEWVIADGSTPIQRPLRLGDQPAIDIPSETKETAQSELILPETEQRERLFEDLPDDRQGVRLVPLLDPRRSKNVLRELCSVLRPGGLDIMRILSLTSRGVPLPARLPCKTIRRPGRRIAVAYDTTDRMTNFLDDAEAVKDQIRRATNAQVVDLPWEIIEDLTDTDRPSSRRRLQHGTHLLFLSDLGYGRWARQHAWQLPTPARLHRLADAIGKLGVTMSALLPVPSDRWEASLPSSIGGQVWSRGSTPAAARQAMERSRRGAGSQLGRRWGKSYRHIAPDERVQIIQRPLAGGPVSPLSDADRVALTTTFCSRINPRRLRALRMTMLPRLDPEAEAEAWHGPHFIRYPSQIAVIDHRRLDAIRGHAISWTRLVGWLEQHAPRVFRTWPDLVSAADDADGAVVRRPKDWARARRALALALMDRGLAMALINEPQFRLCRPELDALQNGRGCVIMEEARDHARTHDPDHVMEPFEDDLLWDIYLDSLASNAERVTRRLARLRHSVTSVLHRDEYRVGLDWTRYRLPHQSIVVQRNHEAQRLAKLASEILGTEIVLEPAEGEGAVAPKEKEGGVELRESWQEKRDLYIWSPIPGRWHLRLDIGPAQQAGQPPPIRVRVPALDRITLTLTGGDRREMRDIVAEKRFDPLNLSASLQINWTGALTVSTGQGASYAITGPRTSDNADAAAWLQQARLARLDGDWTAATRWARRAAQMTEKPAAAFHLAEAAAISEEFVDGALKRIEAVASVALDGRPSALLWRSVVAAVRRMALLGVDSRLQEAFEVGRHAFNLLADNPSITAAAYRLLIGAAMINFLKRLMDSDGIPHIVRSMVRDLRRLAPHRRLRLVRWASANALLALVPLLLEAGKNRAAQHAVREAQGLPRPGEEAVEITALLAEAYYSSYYAPAARTLALYHQALDLARRNGRLDIFLPAARIYCRILYNNAQINKAANTIVQVLDRALQRRSADMASSAFAERAYQRSFLYGGSELPDARAAIHLTPKQERLSLAWRVSNNRRYMREFASQMGVDPQQWLLGQAHAARLAGLKLTELRVLHEAFGLFVIDREAGKRGESPQPSFVEDRSLYLALTTGDHLDGANTLENIARIEFPRWTGKWRMAERNNPNLLYERAIAICDKIQVFAGVLIFRRRWAEELVAAGEARRAQTVIEAAIRYGDGKKGLDREIGLARSQLGEVLRELGRVDEAKEELEATVEATEAAGVTLAALEARANLARLAADEGQWGSALKYLEAIDRTASAETQLVYEVPATVNYSDLIGDLIDGRALNRLEEVIARQQGREPDADDPDIPRDREGSRARGRLRLLGQRNREKAKRRLIWQGFTSRAARLMWRIMTDGGRAPSAPDHPFNDFWYWGEALAKSGSFYATWFLEMALLRAEAIPNFPVEKRAKIEARLDEARSFPIEGPA